MTAIIGIQGRGWSVLASDSMTTYTDKPYVAKGCEKIVKINEYLIAVAGDATAVSYTHLTLPTNREV